MENKTSGGNTRTWGAVLGGFKQTTGALLISSEDDGGLKKDKDNKKISNTIKEKLYFFTF